ncbi:hypothetical protein P3J6_70027 [Pseudoalteromonas sp. 3J6]|jgi:hypothetical protein|nr:hypothetical protein P3J6_70027 [Pseudoalteromonas sp. 3J6]
MHSLELKPELRYKDNQITVKGVEQSEIEASIYRGVTIYMRI